MNSLQPGQACEIADAYADMIDKVQARVIVQSINKTIATKNIKK